MNFDLDSIIMIVYILGMFAIGIYCVRYIKTFDDFFVAGRRLGFWLSIGTLMAIFVGALALVITGAAYAGGMSSIWLFVAYVVGFLILAKTFLVPLRRLEQYTIADIFEMRFGKNCRLVSSISVFFSWTFIFAALVVAGARVLEVSLGWSFVFAIIATAGVFTIYTAIAGMWAVTMTDFVQFVILIAGFMIIFPLTIYKVGGFSALFSKVPPDFLSLVPVVPDGGLMAGLGIIWAIFMLSTPTVIVAPDVYLRIWCMKDDATARKSLYFLAGGLLVMAFIFTLIGMAASILVPNVPAEQSLIVLVKTILPVGISGLVLVALLAAAAAAAVPEVVVCSSILVRDIYQSYINPGADDKKLLKVSRLMTLAVGLMGMGFALLVPGILDLFWIAYRIFVPATVPQVLAAFYMKSVSGKAAFYSMITGPLVSVSLSLIRPDFVNTWFEPVVPGMIVAFLTMIIISKFSKPTEKELEFYTQNERNEAAVAVAK